MEESVIIKGYCSHLFKIAPVIIGMIGLMLIIFGFDGGDFGHGGGEYYGMFYGGSALIIIAIVLLVYISNCTIIVTETRVYGRAAFGKRVDLPMDSVSAIATISVFGGVAVATSSGRIRFIGLANANGIYATISDLLIKRQNKTSQAVTEIKQEIQQSSADELKKFKELFDQGTITKEEFEAKKKQLLGL